MKCFYPKSRRAIAMIELIFAIVIMAIVLLGAPMLISQSTKSTYVGLQQESINAAATQLNIILTKEWDQNNAIANIDSRVLFVGAGDSELGRPAGLDRRVGVPTNSSRKFVTGEGDSATASAPSTFGNGSGNDSVGFDDVDDYEGDRAVLKEVANPTARYADYKDRNIRMDTTVRYVSDSTGYATARVTFNNPFVASTTANSTNTKAVSVTLTSTSSDTEIASKNITLSAFMCNIGHYSFAPPRNVP
ncbi:MAG: hypothetical protein KU28_03680 [Sulfurovum sp. PC08-66]|jgi:hypothetical protein|nr:MAG: hypothetical protein KU28_03680 [Sulfurovum sp. PC08-66]